MTLRLFCGEALCKARVTLPSTSPPWPIRCDACGTALYPGDVLARLPPNELEPKRGELMQERGDARQPIASSQIGGGTAPAREAVPDVDRILGMVDLGDAKPARPNRIPLFVGIAAALLAAVIIALMSR